MDTFVGRDALMGQLRAALAAGRNLVLVGPRRVGKSQLLERMERPGPAGPAVYVLRVTMEGCRTTEGGIATIDSVLQRRSLAAAADAAFARIGKVETPLGSVELAQNAPPSWAALADRLEAVRVGLGARAVLAIALDEVPWWLEAMEREAPGSAKQALAELRALRDGGQWPYLRWIFTGSVGLAGRAAAWGAAKELNDLDLIEVPPLDAASGRHMLRLMMPECSPTDEGGNRAWELSGGRPHWIRLLGEQSRTRLLVDAAAIDDAATALVSRQHRHMFEHEGRSHLDDHYPAVQRALAVHILDVLADADRPLAEAGVVTAVQARVPMATRPAVREALDRLADDFYLRESEDGLTVALALPLFGMWWARWAR